MNLLNPAFGASLLSTFRKSISGIAIISALMALLLSGCDVDDQEISDHIRDLAKDAYIFAYPMLENYRAIYYSAIDTSTSGYVPFNQLNHATKLGGPKATFIVAPNNDTIFSRAVLDLRTEPIVITVPAVRDRYYSIQLIDLYTHNLGYIGSRSTGSEPGSYVVAGPDWQGRVPGGCGEARFTRNVKKIFYSETNFVTCLIRTGLSGSLDLPNVFAIQQKYAIRPLSAYLGETAPDVPPQPMDIFPPYSEVLVRSPAFISYFNFLLGQLKIHPSEKELFKRFAEIGIGPNLPFVSSENDKSIQAGINAAIKQIESPDPPLFQTENGWTLPEIIFGDRETMQGRYLIRAKAARYGLWGNDLEEAYYPSTTTSEDSKPLNGALCSYKIVFKKSQLPPVDAFWSLTMYNNRGFMIDNAINKYSIGDRTEGLQYGADGSLTIWLQRDPPGTGRSANWLPAPNGLFNLTLRMYLPKPEALNPLYAPPPVQIQAYLSTNEDAPPVAPFDPK